MAPGAKELDGAEHPARLAFAELSRHHISLSPSAFSSPPPRTDLAQLLRCCLSSLPYLGFDAGSCRRLLAFLRGLVSRALREPAPSLLPPLEVFMENLVVSDQLRKCFTMFDVAAPEGQRLFVAAPSFCGGLHFVPELVSWHFVLSVSDNGGFEEFVRGLSWSRKVEREIPEIGFPAVLVLSRMGLFSMPGIVRTHLMLLASRCVGDMDPDRHLLAFELAMNIYLRYLPALNVFNRTSGNNGRPSCFGNKVPFSSCIWEATNQRLSCQIKGLLSFCQLHSGDDLPINNVDILKSAVHFIEENQHVIYEQFRQEGTMIVKSIVSNIMGWTKQKEMSASAVQVSEEIVCIAAVVRLLGSSLSQILHYIRQIRFADGRKNANHVSSFKEYSFISQTIRLLGQYEANELHQHNLLDMMGKPVDRERASMLILAHFASLSLYCLSMRIGFLWKGCIIMMMMVMNLVIAEEESLGTFQFLFGSKESANCPCGQEDNLKGLVRRNSSIVMASQFKNIQKVHIRDEVRHVAGEVSRLDTLRSCKSRVGKGNGRAFFECMPEYQQNPSEWNDLLDFVECKRGKDYSSWLKQNKKFKKWKNEKWIRNKKLCAIKNKGLKTSRK